MKLFAAIPILFLAGAYSKVAQDVADPDPNSASCADICTEIAYLEATIEVYGCNCIDVTVTCAAYCKSIETWERAAKQRCDNGCPSGEKNGSFCQSIVASADAANESIKQNGCGDCSNPSVTCKALCQSAEIFEKTIENDEDCSATNPNSANCADICTEIAYFEATAEVYGCDCSNPSKGTCTSYCKSIETWENAALQRCDNGCPSGEKNGLRCQSIVASADAANESIKQTGCGNCNSPSGTCKTLCQTAEIFEKTIENDEDCSGAGKLIASGFLSAIILAMI